MHVAIQICVLTAFACGSVKGFDAQVLLDPFEKQFDLPSALLAGLAQGQAFNAASYAGFMFGTGTNTAYVERNGTIGTLDGYMASGSQGINIESGEFSALKRGAPDLQLDCCSENPGGHVIEKANSGAYMGSLTVELLQELASEGMLSNSGGAALSIMKDLSTIPVDNLATGNGRDIGVLGSEVFTDTDRETMKSVIQGVVDRAALLTAVNITAAVVKCGAGQDADHPVCANTDGSAYYKTYQPADKVQRF